MILTLLQGALHYEWNNILKGKRGLRNAVPVSAFPLNYLIFYSVLLYVPYSYTLSFLCLHNRMQPSCDNQQQLLLKESWQNQEVSILKPQLSNISAEPRYYGFF